MYKLPLESNAKALGKLKAAAVPCASVVAAEARPAIVDTYPVELILRILLLTASATIKSPLESIITSIGHLKDAIVTSPSLKLCLPSPAKVETYPVELIMRILLLYWSAMYKFPLESIASPHGLLKRASVPCPSKNPDVLPPAIVSTYPGGRHPVNPGYTHRSQVEEFALEDEPTKHLVQFEAPSNE
jgi:hypothetical protein